RELPPRWDGTPRYPERIIEPLEVLYTDAERAAHQALSRYAELRTRTAQDDTERFASEFVMKLLKKRLFSSPEAFRLTLEKHLESLRNARRPAGRKQQPVVGILRRQVEALDEGPADDSELDFATDEAVDSAVAVFSPLTAKEDQLLVELHAWAVDAAMRPDAKETELISWLKATLVSNGSWNSERV
ncbi:helicase, partial [Pseudomonas sp. MWU12-2534b]